MEEVPTTVSYIDLYHKLGRLEALMETMMSSVSAFQGAIKDLHVRIDALEQRQADLENSKSSDSGATRALVGLTKDFAIPMLAVAVTWLIAKNDVPNQPQSEVIPHVRQSHVTGR